MIETEQWRQGRAGEEEVIEWLKEQGYLVAATSFIERVGAPLMEGNGALILPDSLVSFEGASRWVEIKTYTAPAPWWRDNRRKGIGKADQYRHGVPLRNWQAYLDVQRVTGIPGSLAILEKQGRLLMQTLDVLRDQIVQTYTGFNMPSGPQVFFDCETFDWHWVGTDKVSRIAWIEPIAARVSLAAPPPNHKQLGLF